MRQMEKNATLFLETSLSFLMLLYFCIFSPQDSIVWSLWTGRVFDFNGKYLIKKHVYRDYCYLLPQVCIEKFRKENAFSGIGYLEIYIFYKA